MREIAEGIALSFGVDLEIELNPSGYLPVENNPQLADELMTYFEQVDGVEMIDCPPAMTGEDFGYLLNKVPVLCSGWVWIRLIPFTILVSVPKEEVLPFAVDKLSDFLKTKANWTGFSSLFFLKRKGFWIKKEIRKEVLGTLQD